jgi:hypothetical protein
MKLSSVAFCLAFASSALIASASPVNKFKLIYTSNGKSIGVASYTLDPTKNGFKLHSTFDVNMDNGGVNDLQTDPSMGNSRGGGGSTIDVTYSSDYKLNPEGTFLSGYSQSSATQAMIVIVPSKSRDSVTVRESRNGTDVGSQTVTMTSPDFFLMPNYDPGAIQALITAALVHPHADKHYLLLVPANPDLGQNDNSAGITALDSAPDATGTLNGSPITLKHLTLKLRAGSAEIYTDEAGNLMEAIIGPLRASYIRDRFSLTPAP